MTTAQEMQSIARLLVERRGDGYQTTMADKIGVSRNSYRQWETGHAIPGDEWVPALMEHLGLSEQDVVMALYRDRQANAHNPRIVRSFDLYGFDLVPTTYLEAA